MQMNDEVDKKKKKVDHTESERIKNLLKAACDYTEVFSKGLRTLCSSI